jgi:hypothetical protein
MTPAQARLWAPCGALLCALQLCACSDSLDSNCDGLCELAADCRNTSERICRDQCEQLFAQGQASSRSCEEALSDRNRCVARLNCAEYFEWFTQTPPLDYPCRSADREVIEQCIFP